VELVGREPAPPIGEDRVRETPADEGVMEHREDVELVLVEGPAACEQEAAVVIFVALET
jgi:hypothetical protein